MKYGKKRLLSHNGYVSKYEDKKIYPVMVSFRRVPLAGCNCTSPVFLFSLPVTLSLSVACCSLIFSAEKFVEMYYLQF